MKTPKNRILCAPKIIKKSNMKELLKYANNSDIDDAIKITREEYNKILYILELKIPKRCTTENAKHPIK